MKHYIFKAVLLFVITVALFCGLEAFYLHSYRRQDSLLYNRIDELSKDKAAFREQFKLAQDMANPLKEGIVALKKSLEDKEKEQSGLIKEINEKQVVMQELKEKLARSGIEIERLNNELLLAKNDKANLVQKNSALNNSLQDIARELALTQESLKELQQNRETLSTGKLKEKEFVRLEKQLKEVTRQFTQAERRLLLQDKFIAYLKRNINLLSASLSEREEEKGTLKSELTRIKAEETSQKERLAQQYKRLKEFERDYDKQRLQIAQLKKSLTQQTQELDNKNREISTLKAQIFSLQSNLESLRRELAEKLESKSLESLGVQKEKTDKERAEELKRKIEVILESGNTK